MSPQQPAAKSYGAFLPLVLIASGIIILFTWNLMIALEQHSNGVRIGLQQKLQLTQASQAEVKLKAMMSDLIELAKSDRDAEAITKHYKISIKP